MIMTGESTRRGYLAERRRNKKEPQGIMTTPSVSGKIPVKIEIEHQTPFWVFAFPDQAEEVRKKTIEKYKNHDTRFYDKGNLFTS